MWSVHGCPASLSRYVLVTVGPVFTEEMWRLACCALQDAFSATLEPVKVRDEMQTCTWIQVTWTARCSKPHNPSQFEAACPDRSNLKAVNTITVLGLNNPFNLRCALYTRHHSPAADRSLSPRSRKETALLSFLASAILDWEVQLDVLFGSVTFSCSSLSLLHDEAPFKPQTFPAFMDEYSQNWFLSTCSFIFFLRIILLIIRIKYSVALMCNINPFFKRWLLLTKPNPYRCHAWFIFCLKSADLASFLLPLSRLSPAGEWSCCSQSHSFGPELTTLVISVLLYTSSWVWLGVWISLSLRLLLSVITRTCTDLIIWNV